MSAAGENSSSAVDVPTARRAPLWLLALITFSGTLAMHIFVPALPLAARDLHAGTDSMQLTISVYVAGLAIGQLLYGPISDRFGRRPTLMAGLALYAFAGLAAALSSGVTTLIAARLFQALGGCAGLVLSRAMVRDNATSRESAKRLALMNLMVNAGPGIAPLIGGAVAAILGWRAIFVLTSALGIVNFLFGWRMLPETGATMPGRNLSVVLRSYRGLLRSPAFVALAIGGGCATTAMYAFISAAPFILTGQFHRPAAEVGLDIAVMVSGLWVGSLITSRLADRVPINLLMVLGQLTSVVATGLFLFEILAGVLNPMLMIATMFVFMIGGGVAGPLALAEAMSVDPRVIGSASGLYGFTQMSIGAICAAGATLGRDPALSSAVVLVIAAVIGQVALRGAVRLGIAAAPIVP